MTLADHLRDLTDIADQGEGGLGVTSAGVHHFIPDTDVKMAGEIELAPLLVTLDVLQQLQLISCDGSEVLY